MTEKCMNEHMPIKTVFIGNQSLIIEDMKGISIQYRLEFMDNKTKIMVYSINQLSMFKTFAIFYFYVEGTLITSDNLFNLKSIVYDYIENRSEEESYDSNGYKTVVIPDWFIKSYENEYLKII